MSRRMTPTTLQTRSRNESNEKAISLERGRRRRYMASSLASEGMSPLREHPAADAAGSPQGAHAPRSPCSLTRHHRPFLRVEVIEQRIDQVIGPQSVLMDQEANDDPRRQVARRRRRPALLDQFTGLPYQSDLTALAVLQVLE